MQMFEKKNVVVFCSDLHFKHEWIIGTWHCFGLWEFDGYVIGEEDKTKFEGQKVLLSKGV